MIAITSNWFCVSCWRAFTLIVSNRSTFFIAGSMGFVFNFFGKIFIVLCTLGLGYIFIAFVPAIYENISGPFFVCIIIIILAYMIASIFISMFSFSMDTMMLCFLVDETRSGCGNVGSHRPKELESFVGRGILRECCCPCI